MIPLDNPLILVLAALGILAILMALIFAAKGGKK